MKHTHKGYCGAFTTSAMLDEEFRKLRERTLLAHVHLLKILRDEDVYSDFIRAKDLYESHYRVVKRLIYDYNDVCDKAYKLRDIKFSTIACGNATRDSMRQYWLSIRKLYRSICDLWSYSPLIVSLPDFLTQVRWGPELRGDILYHIRSFTGEILRR